jgi:hypothetical protein
MSISIVGTPQGTYVNPGVSVITINSSTGVTTGDVIFCFVGTESSPAVTVTTPSGWTLIAGPITPTTGINSYLFQRISDGTDGANYTFNFSGATGIVEASQITYRGVNNTTPINGSVTTASQTSGTSFVLPAVTPTGLADLLVAFVEDYSGFSTGVISGMTQESTVGGINYIFDQQLASSGSTGTRTATGLTSGVSTGFLFAVVPAIVLVSPIVTGNSSTVVILFISGTSWTVPTNCSNTSNSFSVILYGAGGDGGSAYGTSHSGAGGGGGGCSEYWNGPPPVPLSTLNFQIGVGGGSFANTGATWWSNTKYSALGGTSAAYWSIGNGAPYFSTYFYNKYGVNAPNGWFMTGGNGGNPRIIFGPAAGLGGGGCGGTQGYGGGIGANSSGVSGGLGGNGDGGWDGAGGPGGVSANSPGGDGGGASNSFVLIEGTGNGVWPLYGAGGGGGGGGGGSTNGGNGGNGGPYGGGGGGGGTGSISPGVGGHGANGLIYISYIPIITTIIPIITWLD